MPLILKLNITFFKNKSAEMALFHVWHFQPFQRLTLKLTGAVHCSMFYKFTKFPGRALNITWLIVYGKPHQTFAPCFLPLGRSRPGFHPPVSRFRTPASFWSQMATFEIRLGTVETRGGYPGKRVFFPPFCLFLRWLCFTFISSFPFSP